MPRVIGAIDGTLKPIKRPSGDDESAYVCRKGFHAINVQAVCDSSLRFSNVVARWPGASHDSMILSNSLLGQSFESSPPDGWLLGDSGYACRPWLLTPIGNPQTRPEERYNGAHMKTRNTIERAFGVLKSRFRCLHKSSGCLQFTPTKCAQIIMLAFKLHNFCIDSRLDNPPALEEESAPEIDYVYQGPLNDGHRMRKELIQNTFS
ncbi:putative nuclease HARBI1 [Haliotis rubra]|uniref:putative nuclease HARBI1 n=1 Tax=Haliotis rubra TaxID=36100 RepID=UPI001EE54831|nr:putative nuclease HARBI1 [Haliotis rubra]